MTDTATGAAAPADTATTADTAHVQSPATGAEHTAEIEKWKALSRENERRFKAAMKDLDELKRQSMGEQERAVIEAREAGRNEALAAVAGKLVAAEIRAQAAGRLTDAQLGVLLDDLRLDAYVDADGDVDRKRIGKLVDSLAPPAAPTNSSTPAAPAPLDLGQGTRTEHLPLNGNEFDRHLRAALGIRS